MSNLYAINVYDTTTGKERIINVCKEVYDEFRRGEWRIEKNDGKHGANEKLFSALLGGEDGAYENFHEFIDYDSDPSELLLKALMIKKLYSALEHLEKAERELIDTLFFQEISEGKYAKEHCVSQQAVNCRKKTILKKLKKFLFETC